MNQNPFMPPQPDYTAYWAAAAAAQQSQQPHAQPSNIPQYNPQWSAIQPPPSAPPREQSALYANYGYGQQRQPPLPPTQQYRPKPYTQPAAPYAPQYQPAQPAAQLAYNPNPLTVSYPTYTPYPHAPHPQPQIHALPSFVHAPYQPSQQLQQLPQSLPPAKRQRFDGPTINRAPPPPQHAPPPAPSSTGPYHEPGHGMNRGGVPSGPSHMQMGARGGGPPGRGMNNVVRGGRGVGAHRGGMARGRGGSFPGGSNAGRGGSQPGGSLRGHGSRGNVGGSNKNFHNRRNGGSFTGGSLGSFPPRGRHQGRYDGNRSGRYDGSGGHSREGGATGNAGKKDENRRTFTDFKIIGLVLPDLHWSWGTLTVPLPSEKEIKTDTEEDSDSSQVTVIDNNMGGLEEPLVGQDKVVTSDAQSEPNVEKVLVNLVDVTTVETENSSSQDAIKSAVVSTVPLDPQLNVPPSRMRIYFHTPVTADDSRPIPHHQISNDAPIDLRKGKRKKLEDDDGADERERRVPRPPPPMGSGANDDRSSVAASVTETASEGDWLMAAIVDGEEEVAAEMEVEGELHLDEEDMHEEPSHIKQDIKKEIQDESVPSAMSPVAATKTVTVPPSSGSAAAAATVTHSPVCAPGLGSSGVSTVSALPAPEPSASLDSVPSPKNELVAVPSYADHLCEPPLSPIINTLSSSSAPTTTLENSGLNSPSKVEAKPESKTFSANRLSISYAGGNRRLVVDAEVVHSLHLFRQQGRVEVIINVKREDDRLKGISMEGLSDITKSYFLIPSNANASSDPTVPPFSQVVAPSTLTLIVYLDVVRPLSEPKWAKSGDVHEWLKCMFGRMFWVAGDAAEGWEKKIQVVDPDPPPTIWTVLEGWAANSPAGVLNERQRFLRTHMTEPDNILEILLRLVRGERATPFSQSAPSISNSSLTGPLLAALTQGSSHASQQTHVSIAVLAMFRMTVDFAKKAFGDKGESEAAERMGEIIRCLPSHLVYKSLDGIFKEWRVDKKGR